MTNQDQYNTNFFKPVTEHAKGSKKLILRLAIIWAIAVFGFHFLLIFISTPTPEKTLNDFSSVWTQVVEDSAASIEAKQVFAKSLLMVLGKNIAVNDNHKTILKESLSWAVISLQEDSVKQAYLTDINDKVYSSAAASIGLQPEGLDKIMIDLLPTSLLSVEGSLLSKEAIQALPGIMDLYLIHNQSFLTDFQFLGFPFHYWYTAQFLLILFVVLCLVYAMATDRLHEKFKIDE